MDQSASASPFRVIAGFENVPDALTGCVLAIGNFDGVHRGHQAVLAVALDEAERRRVPALAMTFEPHPRTVFRPEHPVFRLSSSETKSTVLDAFGFKGLIVVPFDREFASRSADNFVEDVLVSNLAISVAVTGYDFHFGKARQGTPDFLKKRGALHGFHVRIVDAFSDEGGDIVSSSRVREALQAGDISEANGMLGYRWLVSGEVIHGEKRGRTLGYPTANLVLAEDCRLLHGIYAVFVRVGGVVRQGVASYGRRPTFGSSPPLLEIFIFDFDGDIYGETIEIAFAGFIRPELKFASSDELIAAMDGDSAEARSMLAATRPLSELDLKLGFVA